MLCAQCQTENPTENKFCRECGATMRVIADADVPLTRDALLRRQARVAELLADSLRLREKRLLPEAISLAEEAVRQLPDSVRAFALLSSLYEQSGQYERAVAAMERVVELTPDSIADREKLAELRRVSGHPVASALPSLPVNHVLAVEATRSDAKETKSEALPYIPLIAAGVVAGVVFFSLLPLISGPRRANSVNVPSPMTQAPAPLQTEEGTVPTPGNVRAYLPPDDARPDPFVSQMASTTNTAPATPVENLPELRSPRLPDLRRGSRTRPLTSPTPLLPMPIAPPLSPSPVREAAGNDTTTLPDFGGGNNTASFGNGGRVTVRPPAQEQGNLPLQDEARLVTPPGNDNGGREGYIYIKVHPAKPRKPQEVPPEPAPVEEPVDTGASLSGEGNESGMVRARRLQAMGRYFEAIRAYRDVISSGARGEAFQGMAQSYQRVGDNESARLSYQDAIRAYEAERTQGRSVRVAVQGIAACEAALEVLNVR